MNFEQPGNPPMELLIPRTEIAARVSEMAERINCDYEHRELTIVGIMSGAVLFMADLIRSLDTVVRIETLNASSYRGKSTRPGELLLNSETISLLENRHVLIVDDILDTGQTLRAVSEDLAARNPASLKSAVLLWKSGRTQHDLTPDYFGFKIPDRFVVGYGLDHDGLYRNLPDIRILPRLA